MGHHILKEKVNTHWVRTALKKNLRRKLQIPKKRSTWREEQYPPKSVDMKRQLDKTLTDASLLTPLFQPSQWNHGHMNLRPPSPGPCTLIQTIPEPDKAALH